MNNCCFVGRLVADPEVRYTKSGKEDMAIAKFTIAVNRLDNTADFPRITAFGKTAEVIEKYVKKGDRVSLICHYQSGSYEDTDGTKVYTHDFIVDRFEFASDNREAPEKEKPRNRRSR